MICCRWLDYPGIFSTSLLAGTMLLRIYYISCKRKCLVVNGVCVCLCVSDCTDPDVTLGSGRGCPIVVRYWADLRSVHGFRCCPPKPPIFGGVNRHFRANNIKSKNMHAIETLSTMSSHFKTSCDGERQAAGIRWCPRRNQTRLSSCRWGLEIISAKKGGVEVCFKIFVLYSSHERRFRATVQLF